MKLISAKEIVKTFRISYQTLNTYTDLGLLDVVAKKKRLRMYDYHEVKKRLRRIACLINAGYTLRLIRDILN
ncbi:MAG: helix-turn-helix domain-containing protein [Candidatus Omnitrophica bacterium]|nr:helix-turn-helix domain-containing protein [Candidatus Omnitrophota bacterium]